MLFHQRVAGAHGSEKFTVYKHRLPRDRDCGALPFQVFQLLILTCFLQFLLPSAQCQPFNKTLQVWFEDTEYSLDPEQDKNGNIPDKELRQNRRYLISTFPENNKMYKQVDTRYGDVGILRVKADAFVIKML